MRVQQIDLSYTDEAGDTLGGATLHVQSRTLSAGGLHPGTAGSPRSQGTRTADAAGAETPDPRSPQIDLIRFGRSQKKRAIIQIVSNRLQTGLKISLD